MADQKPSLIFIFGPPAVGKMTVGQEVARLTGLPLFHNHQLIDVLTNFFEYGSPAFTRLYRGYRDAFFEAAAESGLHLIATAGWRFDLAGDTEAVRRYIRPFLRRGGEVRFVELTAPLDERLKRNRTENRRNNKKTDWATDYELRRLDATHRYNSKDAFPLRRPLLRLDTTNLSATATAERICAHFGLPRVDPD